MFYTLAKYTVAMGLLAATVMSSAAADKPTDPQIAHIAYTAGAIDIKAAELALKTSSNESIRSFAADMVRDHKAVNDKAMALLKKLNVTPQDNDTSKGLVEQADAKAAELAKLSGSAFDKAYAENEVAFHKLVNDALATTLIPSAGNEELKSLLETGLKIFKGHQHHAEGMASKLNGG
jgi:putative membrane protein